MWNHYQTIKARERLQRKFDVILPPNWVAPNGGHIYKHNQAPFVINPAGPDNAGGLERECLIGEFGLLPARSRKRDIKRDPLKARSETAAEELSYAIPWRRQHCVIPADCIYEPDWRTGKAIETRIERVDGIRWAWRACGTGGSTPAPARSFSASRSSRSTRPRTR